MVRLIGNVLVFGLATILLSSCVAGVKTLETYTIEKKREPLALDMPAPLELQDVDWIIITKDNADEVFMSGNMMKVTPVKAFNSTNYQIGPITKKTRELYWDWAKSI
mgnify:CR=1 FL=1